MQMKDIARRLPDELWEATISSPNSAASRDALTGRRDATLAGARWQHASSFRSGFVR